MSAGRHGGDSQPVDHPAASEARRRDRRADERGAEHGQRDRAAVRDDDAGGLAEHHQSGRRGEEEHDPEPPEHGAPSLRVVQRDRRAARRGQRHAGARDEPGAGQAGDEERAGQPGQRGADAEAVNRPAEHRRGDHGAGGIQRDEIAVHEAVAAGHREVDHLLYEDVRRSAAEAEQNTVADRELRDAAGAGGQGDAERARGRARNTARSWSTRHRTGSAPDSCRFRIPPRPARRPARGRRGARPGAPPEAGGTR